MPTKTKPRRLQPLDWPEGGELLAEIARRADLSLTRRQCHALAMAFMDTPGLDTEWQPSAGRTARDVLVDETTAVAMLVQAWGDRVQWALLHCSDPVALRNYQTALRVLKAATKYLFLSIAGSAA